MRQVNTTVIAQPVAASINSGAIPSENLFYCSAQITVTGGGAGTLQMQASNDDKPGTELHNTNWQPTNWSNISGAAVTVTGNGSFLIPKTDLCYQYVRLSYTNTGTGTTSVVFKALGA